MIKFSIKGRAQGPPANNQTVQFYRNSSAPSLYAPFAAICYFYIVQNVPCFPPPLTQKTHMNEDQKKGRIKRK